MVVNTVYDHPEPLFSWIHLSDIHIGHGSESHRADQQLVLDCLRQDIAKLRKRGLPRPDAIFVTGDIAFSGGVRTRTEYSDATQWLRKIGEAAGVNDDSILIVPGNHDVQRSADDDRNTKRLINSLRSGETNLDDCLAHESDLELLRSRFANYLDFVRPFCSTHTSDTDPGTPRLYWRHHMQARQGLRVRLVGLNTALLCANDEDQGKLRLGRQQLVHAFTEPAVDEDELVIILSHHPFQEGWLADQAECEQWIRAKADVHLFGHVHEAASEEARRGAGTALVRVAAGAVHEDLKAQSIPRHGYNFGAVFVESEGLELRVVPRMWSHPNREFRRDADSSPDSKEFAAHPLSRVSLFAHEPAHVQSPEPLEGDLYPRSSVDDPLARLLNRLTELLEKGASGQEIAAVKEEILQVRRLQRDGHQLTSGDTLSGRYKLLDRVGQGGFATVWRAMDLKDPCLVAVKVLHGQHAADKSYVQRFFRGARAMSRLQHPNIVRVIQAEGSERGQYYFVMEYLGAGDLRDAVIRRRISRSESVDVVLEIGDALHYAHESNCIHRDVKPHNILLNGSGLVRLTDFDLVHVSGSTGGTRTGSLGSVIYSPPEAWQFAKDADVRGDVYSLAMTMTFGLFGADLPPAAIQGRQFLRHLHCPGPLKAVLSRALDWTKGNRHASVLEFCKDVEAALAAAPLQDDESAASPWSTGMGSARQAIPPLSHAGILDAMSRFDQTLRGSKDWQGWERGYKYAIEHGGNLYPMKEIISMAAGITAHVFSSGDVAVRRVTAQGFKVVNIRDMLKR